MRTLTDREKLQQRIRTAWSDHIYMLIVEDETALLDIPAPVLGMIVSYVIAADERAIQTPRDKALVLAFTKLVDQLVNSDTFTFSTLDMHLAPITKFVKKLDAKAEAETLENEAKGDLESQAIARIG